MDPQTIHVLLVDDEEDFLGVLDKRLRWRGMEVTQATTGHDALAGLAGFAADVVVLDLKMPGMDGLVAIDQIRSIPMIALWEGMMAFPWEGPPPVNTRGLLSVMFEATANPNLDPASGSQYTAKNYFMVARRFCSLQSRFGFHFCGAEALVGDRRRENYAAFQFAGGAANLGRRIRRARFIGAILEDRGFRVKIRQDAVTARLEGFEQPHMERSLRDIGYLILHTRQLDMIMGDRDAVAAREARIHEHLRSFDEPG